MATPPLKKVFEAKKAFATVNGPGLGGGAAYLTLKTAKDCANMLKTHPGMADLFDAFYEDAVDSMADPESCSVDELVVFLTRHPVKSGYTVKGADGTTLTIL